MSIDSTWHDLAVETALVVHVEQITGGAAVTCRAEGCGLDADMLVTSEPDMEPGFLCRRHAFDWLGAVMALLHSMFPVVE